MQVESNDARVVAVVDVIVVAVFTSNTFRLNDCPYGTRRKKSRRQSPRAPLFQTTNRFRNGWQKQSHETTHASHIGAIIARFGLHQTPNTLAGMRTTGSSPSQALLTVSVCIVCFCCPERLHGHIVLGFESVTHGFPKAKDLSRLTPTMAVLHLQDHDKICALLYTSAHMQRRREPNKYDGSTNKVF